MSSPDFADLTIVSGRFERDHGTISKRDAYVVFEYNKQKMQTTVFKNAGRTAVWNQVFKLRPLDGSAEIVFRAYAKGLLKDSSIGETAWLRLDDLPEGTTKLELDLLDKQKEKQGSLNIQIDMHHAQGGSSSDRSEDSPTESGSNVIVVPA